MPPRAIFFKRRNRLRQPRNLVAAVVLSAAAAFAFSFMQKRRTSLSAGREGAARGLASFSALDKEFAEKHLLQGEEEPDPDGEVAPAYRDTLSIPKYDYTNAAEAFLEDRKAEDRARALTEHIAEEEAGKIKEEAAQRIIERNREKGYEIVLDENLNVISATKAGGKKKPEPSQSAPEAEAEEAADGGSEADAPLQR